MSASATLAAAATKTVKGAAAPGGIDAPQRECLVNDASKLLETFSVGDVSAQGDLYIVGIASLPKSHKPRASKQMADGDTQGSRHILLDHIEAYDCDPEEVAALIKEANGATVEAHYIGPVFVSPANPTADDLHHPEHGNQGFPAGTICAVVIQRNLDAEEQAQRAKD